MATRSKKNATAGSARAQLSGRLGNSKQNTCFIIMPFGDWFDNYYETIYVPAIESAGLTPRRADDLYRPSAIVNDIWSLTKAARLILADLSAKTPNVFYELGLAHALAKPAILVAESMEDIPFDLRALRVIVYNKNESNWGDMLRNKIQTAITEVLAAPLNSVLPTFLRVKETTNPKTVTKAEKDLIVLKQEMDLIKRELQLRHNPRAKAIDYPVTKTDAVQFARSYRENGVNDEYVINKLISAGWAPDDAQDVISSLDRLYRKERSRVLSQRARKKDEP